MYRVEYDYLTEVKSSDILSLIGSLVESGEGDGGFTWGGGRNGGFTGGGGLHLASLETPVYDTK